MINIQTVFEGLSFMHKAELDTDQLSEMRSASPVSPETNPEEGGEKGDLTPETEPVKHKTEQQEEFEIHRNVEVIVGQGHEKMSKEILTEILSKSTTGEVTQRADIDSDVDTEVVTDDEKPWKRNGESTRDEAKHETEIKVKKYEEAEGELVAGISLHKKTGGNKHEMEKIPTQEIIREKGEGERERRVETEDDDREAIYDEFPVLGSSLPPTTLSPPVASVDPISLTVALQTPGHHNEQKQLAAATSNTDRAMLKNLLLKPAQAEVQAQHKAPDLDTVVQPDESRSTPKKQPNPTPRPKQYKLSAKAVEHKWTEPTNIKWQPTQSRSDNKAINSKEKKKNLSRTQKPSEKKKVVMETDFHYFMDNYCPLECACYGR